MYKYDPLLEMTQPPVRKPRGGAGRAVPWILLVLLIGGAGAFYMLRHMPLQQAHDGLVSTFNARGIELEKLRSEVTRLDSAQKELTGKHAGTVKELEQVVAEKNRAMAELERIKAELTSKLEQEIDAGDVLVERRGDHLVVDVADKILFPKGEAEVSERGQEVLQQVSETLRKITSHTFQVSGHTDSAPVVAPKTRERYPTNWELSTARATNVVRFLQEQGKVPGGQLVAAGMAQFRPVASNDKPAGRQRNRRIEIALLPKRDQ